MKNYIFQSPGEADTVIPCMDNEQAFSFATEMAFNRDKAVRFYEENKEENAIRVHVLK